VSSNVAAVRLSERVGRENVIRAARDLGVTSELDNQRSLPLGTSGVSLMELVGAMPPSRPAAIRCARAGCRRLRRAGTIA
jgi:membrane peptidoglycan carboxypeptidase